MTASSSPKSWTTTDYGPLTTGSGAVKLADSAIAPLVALAGGLLTMDEATLNTRAAEMGMATDKRNKGFGLLRQSLNPDALAMPWYTFDSVADAQRLMAGGMDEVMAPVASPQWRPAQPLPPITDDGKPRKYLFEPGRGTTIGVHPSTPSAWFKSAPTILLAEGLLKGYSALSAWLADAGVSRTNLEVTPTMSVREARIALTRLMAGIVEDGAEALLIVLIPGVTSWHSRSEWNSIVLKDRTVLVAFDGDIGSNLNVWKQADQLGSYLTSKHAKSVSWLDPSLDGNTKAGVDDYLAKHTWQELLGTVLTRLPARPAGQDAPSIGDVRVNQDKCVVEEYAETTSTDPFTGQTRTEAGWRVVAPMGGRVSSVITRHSASWSDHDMRSGELDHTKRNEMEGSNMVEFEVTERVEAHRRLGGEELCEDGTYRSVGYARGPQEMAAIPVDRWATMADVHIDESVLMSPNWPVNSKWLRAVKDEREGTVHRHTWMQMGYVPTDRAVIDTPVFLVGEKIVTADGIFTDHPAATPGVTKDIIQVAPQFGANMPVDDFGQPLTGKAREAYLREAITRIVETFTNGIFGDARIPGVVLGVALRPCVPTKGNLVLVFAGETNTGKTWTARKILSFWAREPGVLDNAGQASDTLVSMERAASLTPIWVADDNAATTSDSVANQREQSLSDLIRNVANGTSKARSNAKLGQAQMFTPRAPFIVTAENRFSVESVNNRIVQIVTRRGYLAGGTKGDALIESINTLTETTNLCNEVMTACVQHVLGQARDRGWVATRRYWLDTQAALVDDTKAALGGSGDTIRASQVASNVLVGLALLTEVAEQVGVSEDVLGRLSDMSDGTMQFMYENLSAQKENTNGVRIVTALASLLSSGGAYVEGVNGGAPVTVSQDTPYSGREAWFNSQLGWSFTDGEYVHAHGPMIGRAFWDEGELVVVFNKQAAFKAAQSYRELVQPGQKPEQTWENVYSTGLAESKWGRRGVVTRVQRDGVTVSGIPVTLGRLLSIRDEHQHPQQ